MTRISMTVAAMVAMAMVPVSAGAGEDVTPSGRHATAAKPTANVPAHEVPHNTSRHVTVRKGSHADGTFDSQDLIQVFQAGRYND